MTFSNDLVVCSLEEWDEVWRRNQYLISGLLRSQPTMRVLFIELAADPLFELSEGRRPRTGLGLVPVTGLKGIADQRLWRFQPTKFLPRSIGGDVDFRIAGSVIRTARRLGFRNPILWVNDPNGSAVLRRSGWPALYDITDDWLAADRPERKLQSLRDHEDILMRRCAEVVVCSPGLVASKSKIRPVTLIRNAVDVEFFSRPTTRPTDLPEGPLAVYIGTVHRDRIDLELCMALARRLTADKAGTLVLVGSAPLPDGDRQALSQAGAVLLGARDHSTIPGYLHHADVLVVPHVVDDFTDSLDPIKLYEYRAAGRPVVSTPVAGFREMSSGPFVVAQGPAFIDAVLTALTHQTPPGPAASESKGAPGDRIPTWDDRVAQMAEVLDRVRATHTTTATNTPTTATPATTRHGHAK